MTGFSSVTKVRQRRASIKVAGGDSKRRSKLHARIGRLCNFDELPEWQKDNDHIRTGYIRETNSILRCVQAMLYFNNESVNIYSHLFPSLTYFALLCLFTDSFIVPLFPGTTVRDCVMINLYLLGSCLCLGCSTFFHCLKQHSESHSKIWSKIDYVGIIIQITCSIISLLYYGYYDHIRLFQLFTAITLCLGTVCTIFVLHERFNQVDFRAFRATCFVVFGFSGLLPVMIGTLKIGFEWLTRIQIKYVLLEAVFYVSGAIIYGFRIPEMFAPGWFDYIGHSHQIFHIMVVLGSICHFRAVIGSFVFVRTGKHYPGLLMLG